MVHDKLAPVVTGRDAMDVGGAFGATVKAIRNAGRPGVAGYAISAVDVALWDLKARLLGLPLHRLLGAVRDQVPVYGSGGFTAYDERQLREQLSHWALEQRIPRVKIKIGESWGADPARDLQRMHQARAVVGEDVELFVDANGGYARKQAIRVMRAAADLDVRWYEEPVSSDDLDGLREIRDAVRPDVTAGEYGCDLYYFRRMCAAGAVDCLQADVSRCGGITEWLRAAAVAASYGLDISGHCGPHLHAHAAAATPNGRLCPAGDGQPGVGGAVAGGKVDGHRDRGRAAGDRRWRRLRDARPARGLSSPAEAGRVTAGHSRGAAAPKAQPAGSDGPHRARARRARSGPAWPRRRGLRCPAASAASPHRPRFPPRGPARRPFHS